MFNRKITKQLTLRDLKVGGNAPITVQSMLTKKTSNIDECIRQISELHTAGCDIIRLSVLNQTDAKALKTIVEKSPIPVIADIHFDHKLVIGAIESGVDGVRVNPGNIRNFETHGKLITSLCSETNTPIRIGINAGSLEPSILEKYGHATAPALVESAIKEARLFENLGFEKFAISVKHNDPLTVLESYQLLSSKGDWPLHLGVTEAGPTFNGLIKSCSTLGILLNEGIGDTIRISLTDDPIQEVKAGCKLLENLGLRQKTLNIVSCPTCGRTSLDMIALTKRVEKALDGITTPITVAVMGCEVNGPGEAREADIGIACGNGQGRLFIKGETIASFKEEDLMNELVNRVKNWKL